MASQDVLVTYKADVDDLTNKLRLVIERMDKLEAESKSAAKGIDSATKSTDKLGTELGQVGKSTKTATDNIKGFSKTAKTELGGLSSQVKSIGLSIAAGFGAAFSADAIIQFGKASVNAFLEAQQNAEKLRFTITQVGGESEAAFQRLIDQSAKLQKITIFSDDSIQQAQDALATFGLTSKEIEDLLPKLADFASATKTDIVQAAQAVGAGLQGTGREFKKFGIEVSATATATENLSAITEGFARFQGAAAKETETLTGQLKQQANAADDLQEALGSKLAPIFVKLKTVLFEAALGLINFNKAAEDLNDQKTEALEKNILSSAEKIKAAGKDVVAEFSSRLDELKQVNQKAADDIELLNKKIAERVQAISQSSRDISPDDDGVVRSLQNQIKATENIIAVTNEKIKTFTKVIEQEQQSLANSSRTLTAEQLRAKSILELNELLAENNKLNDLISQGNVDAINKEIEARKKLLAKADERIAGSAAEIKAIQALSSEYAALFELLSDEDKAQLIELSVTAELDKDGELERKIETLKELFKVNKLTLPVETDPDGNVNALEDRFIQLKTELEQSGVVLPVTINESSLDTFRTKVAEFAAKLAQDVTVPLELEVPEFKQDVEMNTGIPELAESDLKIWLDHNEEMIDSSVQLFNSLSELYSVYANKQINEANAVADAQIDALDRATKNNEEQLDKRQLTEREFANRQIQIEEQKVKAQEAADKKIREIKRKQAILDKAAALFEVIINTARAIAEASPVVPLMVLAGATGAAQTAIIAAQPIPYKKGSKKTKEGLARVGEEGEEIVWMPGASKVLPAGKTRTYGDVLDKMFDGTFDKHYMKKEVSPQLIRQKQLYDKTEKKSFARNITESILLNQPLPAQKKLDKVAVTNLDELYNIISQNRTSPYR